MDNINITPLGGLGETGALNSMLYETRDSAILVDCGVAFADGELPGVNIVIPEFDFLESVREKLKAVVLTHGHEDHVGALPYLLKKYPVPVYATEFTRGIVHDKLSEFSLKDIEVRNLDYNVVVSVGDFQIDPIFINHSILDTAALLISHDGVKILHCTDFKIDYAAPEGKVTDLARFKKIGQEGLDLLMLDSTNALRKGYTASETKVRSNLLELFTKLNGRVIACLFSSNSYRMQSFLECARITGRKVALVGRSSKDYFRIASQLGRVDVTGVTMCDVEEMGNVPDNEVLVICTGSQAEPRSVLYRMSKDMFRPFKVKEGDTVLMSSRMIPGNEGRIWDLFNRLSVLGATVINQPEDTFIHASGHAKEDELREVIRLVRPAHFIPIHGEYRALKRHIEIACEEGVSPHDCLIALDGDTIEVAKKGLSCVGRYEVERTYVSENPDFIITHEAVRRRNKMAWNGLVAVSVIHDRTTAGLRGPVQVFSEGIFGGAVEDKALKDLGGMLNALIKKQPAMGIEKLNKFFKIEVRHFYKAHFQIRPEVIVLVHEV